MITQAIEDYLKVIYNLQAEEERVTTSAIAQRLDVAPPSVTNMIKKLAEMNLLQHAPYQGVELTKSGEKVALEVIRHHRLVELYLAEALGMSWDKVHAEAEKWEHVLSEELEEKMAEALGQPTLDPHGDPIPARDGTYEEVAQGRLSDLEAGQSAQIQRVSDRDPDRLRYLAELGLFPDVSVEVIEKAPFEGPLLIKVEGEEHALGRELADEIFVETENDKT